MSRKLGLLLGLSLSIMGPCLTYAYEINNHRDMSETAAVKSVLGQASLLMNLRLAKPIDDVAQKFPSTPGPQYRDQHPDCKRGEPLTVLQLIACGAQFEDVPSDRAVNHFFDPANGGRPLTIAPFGVVGRPSPAWVLEDAAEVPGQDFSYRDARGYFYNALTLPQSSDRSANWGKLFQTIGQIIHHLQDMAAPQHVRNDGHCDAIVPCAIPGILINAYHPSKFEQHTSDPLGIARIQALAETADGNSVYPGPNNANVSVVSTPRKFFIGAGKGIAEFTNSNFVSEGTNFRFSGGVASTHPAYPQPTPGQSNAESVSQLFPAGVPPFVQAACSGDPANCFLTFYSTNGVDPLTNQAFTNARASTFSIFDSDLERYGAFVTHVDAATGEQYSTSKVFSLNRFNFDAVYPFLIPRAVAYSAGLINYFFRGKLEISLPNEGVYGIVDHTTAAGSDPTNGGFTRIKLKIRNLTPAGVDAQGNPIIEPMAAGGKLVAVAKFHRNTCYAANLSGEYGALADGRTWRDCRNQEEEIAVSAEVDVTNDINGANGQQITFDFTSQRIPISATDLYLQVVYRGQLGEETDAVVVATKDISEPTYYYAYEVHDQYMYAHYPEMGTGPYTWAQRCEQAGFPSTLECGMSMWPVTTKWQFSSSPAAIPGYDPANPTVPMGTWVDISQQPPLAPVVVFVAPTGSYARVAILTDATPANAEVWVSEWHNSMTNFHQFQWLPGTAVGTRNQRDPATDTLIPSVSYGMARGVYFSASDAAFISSGIQVDPQTLPALVPRSSQVCDLAMPNCGQ